MTFSVVGHLYLNAWMISQPQFHNNNRLKSHIENDHLTVVVVFFFWIQTGCYFQLPDTESVSNYMDQAPEQVCNSKCFL